MDTAALRTIAFSLPWDDAPVDLSFVFESEKPAGRHGFLKVSGSRLVFEDGAEARFWGTNFNSAANFPNHSHSEKVARRLAKFGINIVRFHQMDGDWSTPNIFQFTKGPLLKDTRHLDPRSLDCLDYLIHCLKQEGIYVYLDLLTYRRFRTGDGVAAADQMGNAGRPYSNFDPRLIELQKEFNEQLWTHVNPYTGLAYKDEPAIALTEIVNENDLFTPGHIKNLIEPYRTQLEKRCLAWCREKNLPPPAAPIAFEGGDPNVLAFLLDLQKAYYADMIAHLRRIGVRIPITGTNWAAGGAPLLAANAATDFTDSHTYWYSWSWRVADKRFMNNSFLGERDTFCRALTTFRTLDKPFFVSEWDHPWPNEWRAESPLHLAAVSCLQGWSGAAIHTYRYDCRENVDQIAAPITSDALAGVPYRSGVFDTFNDPAKFGLFYHAALMVRRGDVREGEPAAEVALPSLWFEPPSAVGAGPIGAGHVTAVYGAAELGKIGIRLPGAPARAPRQLGMAEPLLPAGAVEIRSDTGELYRNLEKRYGLVDTPRTKVAYGFLGAAGDLALKGLRLKVRTDFAVIALSSLSDAPLAESDNILLTAVGRADNTGARYNADHTVQFDLGRGPIQVQVIEAELALETWVAGLKISAVNSHGLLVGPVPETYADGVLRFTLGGPYASMYYLIQKA
jgi:hypothetical protein